MSIIKNIIRFVLVIAVVLFTLWVIGFHLETYDYVVGKVTTLWYHNDIIYYWQW